MEVPKHEPTRRLRDPRIQEEVRLLSSAFGLRIFLQPIGNHAPEELPTCSVLQQFVRSHSPEVSEKMRKVCREFHLCLCEQAACHKGGVRSKCDFGLLTQTWPVLSHQIAIATLSAAGMGQTDEEQWKSISTLIERTVEKISRLLETLESQENSLPPEEKAMRWLEKNAGEPLVSALLPRAAGVSRQHLHRLWRKHFGESMGGSIARIRVQRAKELMQGQPNRKIIDVAMECGFGSLSQFNRVFRRLEGRAPNQFRECVRAKETEVQNLGA